MPLPTSVCSIHFFSLIQLPFFTPPKFCGICSYHAHASTSKGSSCARIRKEHNQGIGGCCSFPPKRSVRYISTSTHPIFAPHCCFPLGLTFFILRKTIKMNARTFDETITAQQALPILLLLTLKMADNTNNVTSLRPLHNLY